MRRSLCLLLIFCVTATAAARQVEYIIVSGGPSLMLWEKYKHQPHDLWWMNFIRSARIRVQQLRAEHGPDAMISWLVYAPGYKRRMSEEPKEMFSIIDSVEEAYNVRLIYFDEGEDVVEYLNSGQPRDRIKIASFDYFGHSNKACFMFDYSNEIDSASKEWLHEDELGRIRRGIFTRDAEVVSWGCHTGESMSQKWKAATGVPMRGAIGKTQYLTHELPVISGSGRWVE